MVTCKICNSSFKHNGGLSGHIRFKHKISMQDYKTGNYTSSASPKQTVTQTPPAPQAVSAPQPVTPPQTNQQLTLSQDAVKNVANQLYNMFQAERNDGEPLPQGVSPMQGLEQVEVIGEKINYKVALNPDVFWRWNVFKGQNQRLAAMGKAQMFQGDFADFLDLATKTLLSTYGMYPTVMTLSGGKMLVEMPMQREEA